MFCFVLCEVFVNFNMLFIFIRNGSIIILYNVSIINFIDNVMELFEFDKKLKKVVIVWNILVLNVIVN